MAVTDGFLQMPEVFRDSETAVMYLLSGFANDFPDATIDVLFQDSGGAHTIPCETAELSSVLEEVCADFGEVQLSYHPYNAYGYAAEIVDLDEGDETCRVIILLKRVGDEKIEGGSTPPPAGSFS